MTLYVYVAVIIVITAIPVWWFNSRTGNPVITGSFSQDPGLQDMAYVESVIQLDQIKKGVIGEAPLNIDYKDVQINYDKVKKEWNKNTP